MIQRENIHSGKGNGRTRRVGLWLCLTIAALTVVGVPIGFVSRLVQQHGRDTRLIAAVKRNDTRAVQALLAQGADANAHDDAGRQPSFLRLLQDRLRGKPVTTPSGPTALAVALEWQDGNDDFPPDNPALIKALLDHGANPNDQVTNGLMGIDHTVYNLTLLQLALITGRTHTADLLLDHGADVNAVNAGKQTALMFAASDDDPDTLETLLRRGAALDAQDIHGQTALIWAVISNSPRCIRTLLAHHADRNIRDGQGKTALDWARKMAPDAVRILTQGM